MPRTSALTLSKILGNFFVMFVLLVISFIYSNIIKVYYDRHTGIPYLEPKILFFLIVFHTSLLMLL